MPPIPPIVVFCDLDETVFESCTFSVDESARCALNRLDREQLPLVCCSSRTRAEVELIQQELGINHPFVFKSGAAVFLSRGYFNDIPPVVKSDNVDETTRLLASVPAARLTDAGSVGAWVEAILEIADAAPGDRHACLPAARF